MSAWVCASATFKRETSCACTPACTIVWAVLGCAWPSVFSSIVTVLVSLHDNPLSVCSLANDEIRGMFQSHGEFAICWLPRDVAINAKDTKRGAARAPLHFELIHLAGWDFRAIASFGRDNARGLITNSKQMNDENAVTLAPNQFPYDHER